MVAVASALNGAASGSFLINIGFQLGATLGHTLVVDDGDTNMTRIACGVLDQPPPSSLSAAVAVYPGYAGALVAQGTVTMVQSDTVTLHVSYALQGLTPGITGFLTVHNGTSCLTSGVSYWSADNGVSEGLLTQNDPWGALASLSSPPQYTTDASGAASGSFFIVTGFELAANLGHAFVVHDSTNAPVGCGFLTARR